MRCRRGEEDGWKTGIHMSRFMQMLDSPEAVIAVGTEQSSCNGMVLRDWFST